VVDVARWGYKPSMEVSKMDAMNDTPDEGKPPAQKAQQPEQKAGTYNVSYASQPSHSPPDVPMHKQEKKTDEEEQGQEPGQQEEKENPFAPQQSMDENELMVAKDDSEQPASEEEPAAEEELSAEQEAPQEDEQPEQAAEQEETAPEEEIAPDDEETPEEEPPEDEPKPAPKKGRRGMVKVDFEDFEPEAPAAKPARRKAKAEPEEESFEEEKPPRRKKPKPVQEEPEEEAPRRRKAAVLPEVDDDGEEPITPVTDEDEVLAEKLARIRAKAMKMHPENEEAPAPAKKAGKKPAAKKPAKKGKK